MEVFNVEEFDFKFIKKASFQIEKEEMANFHSLGMRCLMDKNFRELYKKATGKPIYSMEEMCENGGLIDAGKVDKKVVHNFLEFVQKCVWSPQKYKYLQSMSKKNNE